jgi:hypothetical protein
MHYADLSSNPDYPNFLWVGWLDRGTQFPKGILSAEHLALLREFVDRANIHTKGFHRCPFCEGNPETGSSEFHVIAKDGKVFHCPSLIIHYVEEHGYLPPAEFLAALETSPLPDTKERWVASMKALGRKPDLRNCPYK